MTGAIILAAGASTRLGAPKQTLMYKGKSLLQHAVDATMDAKCSPVIVVLGANRGAVIAGFNQQSVMIAYNDSWQQGMGTSIAAGMKALVQENNSLSSVAIMLCDQPFANASLLHSLMELQKQTGKGIAACKYAETIGVPALFDKKYFDALLNLEGDAGAKKLMLQHKADTATVLFEKGETDIDTMNDYRGLFTTESNKD